MVTFTEDHNLGGRLICGKRINPLTPKSDWHLFSPYNINIESHINVMRIKEIITNLRTLDCLTNSPCQHRSIYTVYSMENMNTDVCL